MSLCVIGIRRTAMIIVLHWVYGKGKVTHLFEEHFNGALFCFSSRGVNFLHTINQ